MIKAIIIDDELDVRNDIREKIVTYFKNNINIIAEAGSVSKGVEVIEKHKPDLLFLDIELTGGTSFDLLQRINHTNFQIIFITGFNNHAIKAIKVGALDYILKPVDDDEFKKAVNKVFKQLTKNNSVENFINVSTDYFKGIKNKRIVLKTLNTHHIIFEDDIIYCNSEGNYTTFYMVNREKILISKSMKKVEEIVTLNIFLKCHQSYLVNVNYIEKYISDGFLILKNNIKIPISSRRKEIVLNRIAKV